MGESRKERDYDAGAPSGAFAVCSDDAMDEGVSDFILDDGVIDDRAL